jgi:hypothetical protein
MNEQRRWALMAGAGLVVLGATGCTTTTEGGGDPVARRTAIDAAADSALARLYAQHPGSKELVASARGALIFPSVVSAGRAERQTLSRTFRRAARTARRASST